jgi:inorganic pyrophosphatase
LSEDGDPCDVLVLIKEPTFVGCEIRARPIGMLRMVDRGEPDEKILAVPSQDPFQNEFTDIADLPQHQLNEIEHFFQIYKDLEGKRTQMGGWEKSVASMRLIEEAMGRYRNRYPEPKASG